MDMARPPGDAQPTSIAASGISVRQTLAFVAFGAVYYLLAAYAANLPLQAKSPLFIWPAHGLALGTLLVAPLRRWPAYLVLVLLATIAVGLDLEASWERMVATCVVNVSQPLFVAAGLIRLAGPRLQVDTLRGLAAFLVGMVPLVAAMAILDSFYGYVRFDAPFRQLWSVTFVSTMLGMLLTAPLILAWSRKGWDKALRLTRERLPEIVVMYAGLIITSSYVFSTRPDTPGFVPPLAYLCSPFLIWAALRFGLRAATLGLAIFGLILYWHAGQGFGPFSIDGVADVRSLLHLQGYLATIVITTLFSATLLVERQDAIDETEEWRGRHERVIRASGSLLYEFDPSTGQLIWDGDMNAVLGTTPGRVATSRLWMARVHPDDRVRLRGLRQILLSGEISHIAVEYRFRRDDGQFTTLGVNAYVVADGKERRNKRVIGFVKDVSDKVRAEEERQRLAAQLRQAEKMQAVGHLAGGIAHDFNNILGAILGYGELAQKKAGEGDLRRYLDTIMDAGNRAKSLVTQILSYSRAEGTEKIPVLVAPIAREACELIMGSHSGLEIRFESRADEAAVRGDPTRIHQLVMNLCTNAIQAMGGAGSLVVAVDTEHFADARKVRTGEAPEGDYVRVSVRDTGHGIAPEVIDRIFEPFFTTKKAGQGTGLGLALVHSVVMEHQGFIDVASELGRGTTFTVWMPQLPSSEGVPRQAGEKPHPLGAGQVVLAVDDEPEVLGALEEMLASLGYEPVGFRDSREALAAARADPRRFDAVVSDEVMPEMSGTQLAIELRKLNPTLPILIASGYGGSGFETRALSAGVNRVLKKPYRMGEIAEVLAGFFADQRPPE